MAPQAPAYNIDWVYSNNSNVHIATDRAWFTTYTEFPTKFAATPGGPAEVDAQGVGSVVLETRVYDNGTHKRSQKITLHNVLYVPTYKTNVFALDIEEEYITKPRANWSTTIKIMEKNDERIVGLIVRNKLQKLWLKGQSKKTTSLRSDNLYYIHATWPVYEYIRWEMFQLGIGISGAPVNNNVAHDSAYFSISPFTDAEKRVLKKHYGGEFKFLQMHGLSIYKDDDRVEGRQLLRSIMAMEDDDDDNDDDDDDNAGSIDSNQFLADISKDPMSRMADSHFSKVGLRLITKQYGHTANFMHSYGLRPYDDNDCEEAAAIAEALAKG